MGEEGRAGRRSLVGGDSLGRQTSFRQTLTHAQTFTWSHTVKSPTMRKSMFSYWITSNGPRAKTHRWGVEITSRQDDDCWQTDLAPNQHGTEDDLETIEEVVSYDDDCSAPRSPPLAGTDGFNAGSCSWREERRIIAQRERERKRGLKQILKDIGLWDASKQNY